MTADADRKTKMDAETSAAYWRALRDKVPEFDRLDDSGLVFGARTRGFGHHYKILPVVTDEEIQAFEKNNGFALPADYRIYLQNFGAGGAGPDYGVADFRTAVLPHRFDKQWPYTEETWGDDVPDDDPLFDLPGLAYLIDRGCAVGYLIELNGATPGRMWCDWAEACTPGGTLIDMYRGWEEQVETGLKRYHILKAFIGENGKIPKLTLADVAAAMGCAHRTVAPFGDDEENVAERINFEGTPGVVFINARGDVVRIDVGGQIG